jgi:hypothetical protein
LHGPLRMINAARLPSLLAACLLAGVTLRPDPARAAETTAAVWYHDCQAYIGLLRGTSDGDDLEITYCMGQTLGIIEGLRTGSRIGALSMASLMAVLLGLDREQVFDVFKDATTEDLLGYCVPPDQPGSSYIEVVADYLDRNPASLEVSATAAFFEALREAYPCAENDPSAPADDDTDSTSPPTPETDRN